MSKTRAAIAVAIWSIVLAMQAVAAVPESSARAASAVLAGGSRSRWMAVSARATVLVATGPANKPIRLGDQQPWSPENTLHVWDWSKSDRSRPLNAITSENFALSPDGRWVLSADGQVVDTSNGEARKLDDFPADVHGLCFAPAGDAVLAQIGAYTGPAGKEGAVIRVLDFPSGKTSVNVPGQWACRQQ